MHIQRLYPRLARGGLALLLFGLAFGLVWLIAPPRIVVSWETASEVEVAGFAVLRGLSADGPFEALPGPVIPARGDPLTGASYRYEDRDVAWGALYYYALEEVAPDGARVQYPRVVRARAGAGWGLALAGGVLAAGLGSVAGGWTLNRWGAKDDNIDRRRSESAQS